MSQHSSQSFHVPTIPQKLRSEGVPELILIEFLQPQFALDPPENAVEILPDQGFTAFLAE
jgi:hypothetical protein